MASWARDETENNCCPSKIAGKYPYKATSNGDPPIRLPFPIDSPRTNDMRGEQFLHSLTRITKEGKNISPESQNIGSIAGFQALLCNEVTKSKPYYWLAFPKPPRKSVTYETMTRILKVIDEKNMPFVLLTRDQPVYILIVQIRNENYGKFN